jgi:1,2-diacylglycerol 3-beta-galactosyltransferase
MTKTMDNKKLTILIIYASAGGGHKSAALALKEAFELNTPGKVDCILLDALKESRSPLDLMPEAYNQMIKVPNLIWRPFYELGEGKIRAKMINQGISKYVSKRVDSILEEVKPDVVVTVYHFANTSIMDSLERLGLNIPVITVVTDLVTIPAVWFDNRVDHCILPTERAIDRALYYGMNPKQLSVIGLPISEQFRKRLPSKKSIREKYGWPTDKPLLLLMAGGEGVGPLYEISRAIAAAELDVTVVVVTGKNYRLKRRMQRRNWQLPVYTYGYVDTIPDFMRAADVFITKAGPGNLAESFAMGLPSILYSYLPGQEEGNVSYVTDNKAGVWAPTVDEVVLTLQTWLKDKASLKATSRHAALLARPNASRDIATFVQELVANRAAD